MKGLFPSSQLGANYLNAKKSGGARNSTSKTCQHALPVLCSRCGEPANNSRPSLRTWLATGANLMCLFSMLGTCFLVQDLGYSWSLEPFHASKVIAHAWKTTVAIFTFCTISHITIAHRAFGMSLRHVLRWAASVGGGTGVSTILLLKTTVPAWEKHWPLVVQFVMWAVLVALVAVYAIETIHVERETPETKGEAVEVTDEKLRI